ncbi:MAG: hypothetical protein Q8Q87_00820 [Candidatus Omnitrophota bacterium]|nr:hypothetical protein [Candidatus Omnitrophota bacterium]
MKRIFFIALIFLLVASAEGSCESYKYEPHGRRDPFVPLIGQDKAAAAGLADVTSIEEIKLEGIAINANGKRTAIMNGEIVKEGDKTGDVQILKVGHKSVTLLINDKEFKVSLPEEGGSRGE